MRRRWYALVAQPGQEFAVKSELDRRAAAAPPGSIGEVVIPTDQSVEARSEHAVRVETRTMPGYVLVNMELTDAVWSLIRATRGVAGIVGAGNQPVPLSQLEVDRLLNRSPRPERVKPAFTVGASIEVVAGPFIGLSGEVVEVNEDAARLKLAVSMFGRETPAELDFDQVKAVQ